MGRHGRRGALRIIDVVGAVLLVLVAGEARSEPLVGPPSGGAIEGWPPCWRGGADEAPCAPAPGAFFEGDNGFVTAWGAAGPFEGKAARGLKKADAAVAHAARGGWRMLASADGRIALAESERLGKRDVPDVHVLAARVFVPVAQEVRFRFAVNGEGELLVGGRSVWTGRSDEAMLADERRVDVRLPAGWSDVAVVLRQMSRAEVAWMLRGRRPDGGRVDGLAWALPSGLAPGPEARCAVLGAELEVRPERDGGGWRVVGRLAGKGLVPWPAPERLALAIDGRPAPLAEVKPGLDALAAGAVTVEARLPADARQEVSLVAAGHVCDRVEVGGLEVEASRWRAAREAISGLAGDALGPFGRESLEARAEEIEALLTTTSGRRADRRRLQPLLDALEGRVAAVARGEPLFQQPGVHRVAYRSSIDGTLRTYLALVPKNHRPERGDAPLVVLSHGLGYTPEDMLSIALGKPAGPHGAEATGRVHSLAPPDVPRGAILVAPDGYGSAGQRPPGRTDVLDVLADALARFSVDPNRVTLSGFSLGGSVAFWVPLLYPDRFAAAAPLCGYPNLHDYSSVRRWKKRPWEEALIAHEGVVEVAENGRHLPLRMVHGTRDNPSRSQLIHDRYQALRYASSLALPDAGHNVWDEAFADGDLLAWLASQRRDPRPSRVTLRTARYRTASADWLTIDRFARHGDFGTLDGTAKKGRVEVRTTNVDAFTLHGRRLPGAVDTDASLVVDGVRVAGADLRDTVHLAREGRAGWAVVDAPALGAKRAGAEGPLGDIHHDAFVVVYGTRLPGEVEANRLTAERWRTPAPWIDLRPPLLTDTTADLEALAGRHIVLVGRPESNALTARFAEHLEAHGVVFEPGAIRVGPRRFAGPGVGISVILPAPHDATRSLVLHAGVDAEGTLSARHLPELAPDLLVYDDGIRASFGDRILGRREVLHGAFFDGDWRLPAARRDR